MWTQKDLDSVTQAIRDLVANKREVSITWSDAAGSGSTTYQSVDIDKLRDLQGEINDQLRGRRRSALAFTGRGL